MPYTGSAKYVFPTPRSNNRPLSENGVLSALRNMGYTKEQMTVHGFRSMASTLLNELGHTPDDIEAQLAHKGAKKASGDIISAIKYMYLRTNLVRLWA